MRLDGWGMGFITVCLMISFIVIVLTLDLTLYVQWLLVNCCKIFADDSLKGDQPSP